MTPTYASLVRRFGLTFRPDFPAYAYGEHPNAYHGTEVQVHDGVVRAAFAEYEANPDTPDPYGRALAVWREDGLLGAGDPGPPAFRAAHEAYLAGRAAHEAYLAGRATPPAPRLSEVTFTSSPTGRPRVPLQEILDAVAQFSRETSALRINTRTQGTFDEMERVFNIHRDLLVAWFAERGVDVVP